MFFSYPHRTRSSHPPSPPFGIDARFTSPAPRFVALALAAIAFARFHASTAQDIFWRPVFDTPGSVLLAVGDVPNGPPTTALTDGNEESSIPTLQAASSSTVPFADTVTIANVVGILEAHGKKVLIRRESASSFSDLREGPVVLIGAFNNEWSLRLTHGLRYTLALDGEKHLIYIKDVKNPQSRAWSWGTDQPTARQPRTRRPGSPGLRPDLPNLELRHRSRRHRHRRPLYLWHPDCGRVPHRSPIHAGHQPSPSPPTMPTETSKSSLELP